MREIDTGHFLADLDELRRIGAYKTGVHRPTYSPQDMESRRWLMERMEETGLEARDRRHRQCLWPAPGRPARICWPAAISRRQNEAGWLDGALGVVAAVALARAGLPVDVGRLRR